MNSSGRETVTSPVRFGLEFERPRVIALVIGQEPSIHSIFLAVEPFRAANRVSGSSAFTIDFIAADPDVVPESMNIAIPLTVTFASQRKYDLVMLLTTYGIAESAKPCLFKWLRMQSAAGAHLSGIDTGPLLLAEAGLLKGYTATCHWSALASLRELCPEGKVVEQIYVVDRNRSTCAGQVATLDFSMALLKNIYGETLYNLACNELIYVTPRLPETQQRELVKGRSWGTNPTLNRAQRIMQENVESPLELEKVAERCGVSLRELQHLFKRHLNSTPKKTYMSFRLQHAKELLRYSSLSIQETGLASGFATPSAYYKAFSAVFQTGPAEYRRDFVRSQATVYGRNIY
jgi:transcriptional regulator GlxA family with amidase domain